MEKTGSIESEAEARQAKMSELKAYGRATAGLLGTLTIIFLFGVVADKAFNRRPDGSRY